MKYLHLKLKNFAIIFTESNFFKINQSKQFWTFRTKPQKNTKFWFSNFLLAKNRLTSLRDMVYLVESKADLDKKIAEAGEKLIVIDFYATWCGPCKVISPRLEELAVRYSEHALVLKVNVDDNEEITVEYNVTSMPTFVFIKNSEVVEIFVGSNSDKLAKSMEKYVIGKDSSAGVQPAIPTDPEQQEEQPEPVGSIQPPDSLEDLQEEHLLLTPVDSISSEDPMPQGQQQQHQPSENSMPPQNQGNQPQR